jgi:hypothetical protein
LGLSLLPSFFLFSRPGLSECAAVDLSSFCADIAFAHCICLLTNSDVPNTTLILCQSAAAFKIKRTDPALSTMHGLAKQGKVNGGPALLAPTRAGRAFFGDLW